MSNKQLFHSIHTAPMPLDMTTNTAGGLAYSLSPELSLANMILTGTLNNTFYATAEDQLTAVLGFVKQCKPEFIAQLAVYARKIAYMKDTPVVLLAYLSTVDKKLFKKIFPKVVDNPKMVRNFVQIIRSGQIGRKSLGRLPRNMIRQYLGGLTDDQLFRGSIGNDPSMADVIRLSHPKSSTPSRSALYSYLLGYTDDKYKTSDLPDLVKSFEDFKKNLGEELPKIPMEMITALPITDLHWKQLAKNASWTQSRMNIVSFARHNVFKGDQKMIDLFATKLSDLNEIQNNKVLPYQCFAAYKMTEANKDIDRKIVDALEIAVENSMANVPSFGDMKIKVLIDVSGSMSDPATGQRTVSTSIRCVDVAALMASAILKQNPNAEIIPFDTSVHKINNDEISSKKSVAENASRLAKYGGGGTNCGCAVQYLNKNNQTADLVIMISDNQSLPQFHDHNGTYGGQVINMQKEWETLKKSNPNCKLINLDITPYATTQTKEDKEVLNCFGFSDQVFNVIKNFINDNNDDLVLKNIQAINLDPS